MRIPSWRFPHLFPAATARQRELERSPAQVSPEGRAIFHQYFRDRAGEDSSLAARIQLIGATVAEGYVNGEQPSVAERFARAESEVEYFFVHAVQRVAFHEIGTVRRARLIDNLVPLLASSAAEKYADIVEYKPEAIDEWKKELEAAYTQTYNQVEREYAETVDLFDKAHMATGNGAVNRFAAA
jgi:hypothetical protein